MKYIKIFESFENNGDCPFDDDQERIKEEVMDIFSEMKDKWLIKFNKYLGNDSDYDNESEYWFEFEEDNVGLSICIDRGYLEDIEEEKDFVQDIENLIKRLEIEGFVVDCYVKGDISKYPETDTLVKLEIYESQ